jgi:hypothetical protein
MRYSAPLTVRQPAATVSSLEAAAGAGSLKTVASPLPVRSCTGEPPESNRASHSGRGIARARKGRAPDFRTAPAVRRSGSWNVVRAMKVVIRHLRHSDS